MTPAEWTEAVRLFNAFWPRAQLPPESASKWFQILAEIPGTRVHQALYRLASEARYPPGSPAVIADCCRTLAVEEHAERREALPFGVDPTQATDRAWNALPAEEQRRWLRLARAQWPPWLTVAEDSPLLRAQAAALARGVDTTALLAPVDRYHRCGCGAALLPGLDPSGKRCRNCAKGKDPWSP